jgi:hypothetical protein
MKFFNKQVLAAAIIGVLASGNALAQAEIDTDDLVYASEIAVPVNLTVPVVWTLGYNFNNAELRYACLKIDGATPVQATVVPSASDPLVTVGAVNFTANVAFFTITNTLPAGTPTTDVTITVPGLQFAVTDQDDTVYATVGLYDNPAAAGACNGGPQLIPGSYDQERLISFDSSYTFTIDPNKATASVEMDPSFSGFKYPVAGVSGSPEEARLAWAQIELVDDIRLKADGTPIALSDIFPSSADLVIEGDFGDWLDTAEFGGAAGTIAGDSATWDVDPTNLGEDFWVYTNSPNTDEIPAGIYTAGLTVTPNDGYDLGEGDGEEVTLVPTIDESLNSSDNSVDDLSANAGQIIQDGVRLQTPLVQLAGGDWLARLVISNTGTKDRTFTLKAQTEDGNSVTTPDTVYTVKAGKTYVFENLADVLSFSGRARGTVVAVVAGPEQEIKGIYQIVNTSANTISNVNLINQNGGTGH